MGWLFMRSLQGHPTPKAYLDHQFTFERPGHASRVMASAVMKGRTYYAAVEHLPLDGERVVFAVVCLVRYNPRDRQGYIFGYKDMDEGMGPAEAGCPASVLDLLTPTAKDHALAWRARCRAHLAESRAQAAKPSPKPGQIVVFDVPLRFQDGRSFTRLRAIRVPHRRGLVFQSGAGGLYRVPKLKSLGYRIEDAGEVEPGPLI